jgi:uncharacterized protein involved in response to NO
MAMTTKESTTSALPSPVWRLAFRAGFLLAGCYAALAMGRWLAWITGAGHWWQEISPHWWHAHEMIFGFALPVVAGFLLTAVATWTGIPGTRGLRLQVLFGCWLVARIALWLTPTLLWLAWLMDAIFLILTLYELVKRVWTRRQWRNMLFCPVLLALLLLNSASYYFRNDSLLSTQIHYGALWMISVLVVIVGGRVIPLFTANRLGLTMTPQGPWLDTLAIGSVAMVGALSLLPSDRDPEPAYTALCLATGIVQLHRMTLWQGWKTFREPLLWSMHLSYLCLPLTLFGWAWAGGDPVLEKNLIHLLAIGTVGGMILAMMSRVSLGHTGRPLVVPSYIATAFALVFIAALTRACLPLVAVKLAPMAWYLSAVLWMAAFLCFLWRYTPILLSRRPDGKDG